MERKLNTPSGTSAIRQADIVAVEREARRLRALYLAAQIRRLRAWFSRKLDRRAAPRLPGDVRTNAG